MENFPFVLVCFISHVEIEMWKNVLLEANCGRDENAFNKGRQHLLMA